MSWLAVLLLAAAAFLVGAFVLRLPRKGWAMLGAVLMLGLAGYAYQASPDLPTAATQGRADTAQTGEEMVAARRSLFDPTVPLPAFLTLSDAFARRGRYEEAANILRAAMTDNSQFGEGWLAMANALVEHAEGNVTPASLYAYQQAEATLPGNPGPAYFLGFAYLRSGEVVQARKTWADLLARTPADAPWRAELELRISQLDALISQMQGKAPANPAENEK